MSLIEAVGVEEYNRRLKEFLAANPIRPVGTRFGTLYAVTGTDVAFATRKAAEDFLASLKQEGR